MGALQAAQLLGVVIGLVEQGAQAYGTLEKVTAVIKERQAAGQDVTKDDLHAAMADNDAARAALQAAIDAAP